MRNNLNWTNDPKYRDILEDLWFRVDVKKIIYAKEIESERKRQIRFWAGFCGLGIILLLVSLIVESNAFEIVLAIIGMCVVAFGVFGWVSTVDCEFTTTDPVFERHKTDDYETVYAAIAAHSEEIKKIADDEYRRQHPDPIPAPKDAEEKFVRFVSGKIPANY